MTNKTERVQVRFSADLKILAQRAALVSGYSLTGYLAKLVREDAPRTLKAYSEIQLTGEQFDHFLASCEQDKTPSKRILEISNKLDNEGF